MNRQPRRHLCTALVWTAAALGGVHAAFSAYWALGGSWLLRTVSSWAVDLRESSPVAAPLGLGVIALAKLVAAAAVLAGLISSTGGFDRSAMIGHAFLWDPIFALWGAALVASLALSRRIPCGPS